MRLEPGAVRHVNGVRRNIVNRGEAIVTTADTASHRAQTGIVGRGIGQRGRGGFAEELLENALEETRPLGAALRGRYRWCGVASGRRAWSQSERSRALDRAIAARWRKFSSDRICRRHRHR